LLGSRAKRQPHGLVINEIIDARLGGDKIVVDLKNDAGQGMVLISRPVAHVDMALILNVLEIDGVNSFNALSIEAKSRLTLNATVGIKGPVRLALTMQVAIPNHKAVAFTLTLGAQDLFISVDLLVALDSGILNEANTKELLGCFAHSVASLQFPSLVTLGTVTGPDFAPLKGGDDSLPRWFFRFSFFLFPCDHRRRCSNQDDNITQPTK